MYRIILGLGHTEGALARAPMSAIDGRVIVVSVRKLLKPLIPDFLANRRQDVTSLLDAIRREDYGSIGRLGHNLKGLGGTYGFHPITDWGAAIEEGARTKDAQRVVVAMEQLDDYLGRVEVIFK